MQKSVLIQVAKEQKKLFAPKKGELKRDILKDLPDIKSHALIISGIRRCGKSTLLHQFMSKNSKKVFFLNFEDTRLYNFQIDDFRVLDKVIEERKEKILFFDELQVVPGWELYIRQKLDQGFQLVLTGSNASMLSIELGTKLTGRHITKELFPFSYSEYLHYTKKIASNTSFQKYLDSGGFPLYVKTKYSGMLSTLIDDILFRDIAVRYNVNEISAIKKLCLYILSNTATLVVPSKLKQYLNINAASTVLNYFAYFENTYLVQLIPKFSWSKRSQLLAPKKMYVIDTALVRIGSVPFSDNKGRLLETVVFWQLRRKTKELYYFNNESAECDFVVPQKNKKYLLIQVCWELHIDNEKREIKGLLEAMKFFKMKKGVIVTSNTEDYIIKEGKEIVVMPFYKYFKILERKFSDN